MTSPQDVKQGLEEYEQKLLNFLAEYRELCGKHGLMIVSDGEEIQIGEVRHLSTDLQRLWGLDDYEHADKKT